jgi:hypothetical protein
MPSACARPSGPERSEGPVSGADGHRSGLSAASEDAWHLARQAPVSGRTSRVSSQRDAEQTMLALERRELAETPEAELAELARICPAVSPSSSPSVTLAQRFSLDNDLVIAHPRHPPPQLTGLPSPVSAVPPLPGRQVAQRQARRPRDAALRQPPGRSAAAAAAGETADPAIAMDLTWASRLTA